MLSSSDKHRPDELVVGRDSLTAWATIRPTKGWEISEVFRSGLLGKRCLSETALTVSKAEVTGTILW